MTNFYKQVRQGLTRSIFSFHCAWGPIPCWRFQHFFGTTAIFSRAEIEDQFCCQFGSQGYLRTSVYIFDETTTLYGHLRPPFDELQRRRYELFQKNVFKFLPSPKNHLCVIRKDDEQVSKHLRDTAWSKFKNHIPFSYFWTVTIWDFLQHWQQTQPNHSIYIPGI